MDHSGEEAISDETRHRLAKRLARYVNIHGHPWFYRMKAVNRDSGLTGYYTDETLKSGLVVACDVKGDHGIYKRFAYFSSWKEFLDHQAKYPLDERHFYEVIGATTKQQRPYFDIDIPGENFIGDELECIIQHIVDAFKDNDPKNDQPIDYVVYETKYPIDPQTEIPKKYSYHVVINGLYFESDVMMRNFGQLLKQKIADKPAISMIAEYIDDIWHSTRQFRLAGSSKIGSNCQKLFHSSSDGTHPTAAQGFVTNIAGCKSIPF